MGLQHQINAFEHELYSLDFSFMVDQRDYCNNIFTPLSRLPPALPPLQMPFPLQPEGTFTNVGEVLTPPHPPAALPPPPPHGFPVPRAGAQP